MQEGNRMHEAGRRELLGRNASEGIEPRNSNSRESRQCTRAGRQYIV